LLREIGRGAYGEVWLARDAVGIIRAVKVIQRRGFADSRPYDREFEGIRRFVPLSLEHPGLIRVLHVGRDDRAGFFHYVMEAADNAGPDPAIDPEHYTPRTLAEDLERQGPLPPAEVARLGSQMADALAFLHRHRLVHRDLKPANILFVQGRPKLGDIGLVSPMAATDRSVSFLGTQGYIAPEGPGSAAADLFSLGKLLYVVATGCNPDEFPKSPAPERALAAHLQPGSRPTPGLGGDPGGRTASPPPLRPAHLTLPLAATPAAGWSPSA
jgi:serine/threonine protein kinase